MRVALAVAATIALPIRAAAQTPTPPPAPTAPAPGTSPAPAPAPAPVPAPEPASAEGTPGEASAPGETPPSETPPAEPLPGVDPAYGGQPEPNHDTRDFPAPTGKDVIIVSYPDRSKKNMLTMAILGGAGVVTTALGLYFHMDSRSAAADVGADNYTGEVWSAAHEETYDSAYRSSIAAGVFYGIGGALLLATAITYIATEPEPETMVIHPHSNPKTSALVAPTRGGAIVGGRWSF